MPPYWWHFVLNNLLIASKSPFWSETKPWRIKYCSPSCAPSKITTSLQAIPAHSFSETLFQRLGSVCYLMSYITIYPLLTLPPITQWHPSQKCHYRFLRSCLMFEIVENSSLFTAMSWSAHSAVFSIISSFAQRRGEGTVALRGTLSDAEKESLNKWNNAFTGQPADAMVCAKLFEVFIFLVV